MPFLAISDLNVAQNSQIGKHDMQEKSINQRNQEKEAYNLTAAIISAVR
jgi:hypothetical protein